VGGVISQGTLQEGRKHSYSFLDLRTGASRLYARRRDGPVPQGQLAFEFLDDGIAFGCAAVRGAAAAGVDALFIDEIGPLEIGGGGLWQPLREARSGFSGVLVLTTRPNLLAELIVRLSIRPWEVRILRAPDFR
jgi:nucleoside-triphosphatase THEP1